MFLEDQPSSSTVLSNCDNLLKMLASYPVFHYPLVLHNLRPSLGFAMKIMLWSFNINMLMHKHKDQIILTKSRQDFKTDKPYLHPWIKEYILPYHKKYYRSIIEHLTFFNPLYLYFELRVHEPSSSTDYLSLLPSLAITYNFHKLINFFFHDL